MGKWAEKSYDDELVRKIKVIFNGIEKKLEKDNPNSTFGFENFVETFDVNDKFVQRMFEFLVKETAQSHRRERFNSTLSQPGGPLYSNSESSSSSRSSRSANRRYSSIGQLPLFQTLSDAGFFDNDDEEGAGANNGGANRELRDWSFVTADYWDRERERAREGFRERDRTQRELAESGRLGLDNLFSFADRRNEASIGDDANGTAESGARSLLHMSRAERPPPTILFTRPPISPSTNGFLASIMNVNPELGSSLLPSDHSSSASARRYIGSSNLHLAPATGSSVNSHVSESSATSSSSTIPTDVPPSNSTNNLTNRRSRRVSLLDALAATVVRPRSPRSPRSPNIPLSPGMPSSSLPRNLIPIPPPSTTVQRRSVSASIRANPELGVLPTSSALTSAAGNPSSQLR